MVVFRSASALGRKMNRVVLLLLLLFSLPASADSFYVLAGYVCDQKADELRITYDGAYNEAGETMIASRSKTQWDPWQLVVAKDDHHIGSLKIVRAKCRLSDGTYGIEIKPSPGNFNVQGRCGAWMTAGAKITKGKMTVTTRNPQS
jgi:hypothetical protein